VPAHLSRRILTQFRRLRFSIASTGLRRALADAVTLFLAYDPGQDETFDRQFGTDTTGRIQTAELGISDAMVREQAILYLPSPARVTRWMLENVGIRYDEYSFVDLGCGKGRALLVASNYPFARIVGVEISRELSEIARTNNTRYQPPSRKCRAVEIQHRDATTVDFPATNLLLHLYHPFEPPVTNAVLSRLEESIANQPRRVVIAYLVYTAAVQDVEAVFSRFHWLRKTRYEQSITGQYNCLFYSN